MTTRSKAIVLIAAGFVLAPLGLWAWLEQGSVIGGVCSAVAVACTIINVQHL